MNDDQKVLIFTTGGTIEKIYLEEDGTLENRGSILRDKLLSRLRLPYTQVEVVPLMNKDSLYMTDEDREFIWTQISGSFSQNKKILVLHGTDTMTVTAEYFYKKMPSPPVPVIFTGAMKPMGFDDSDATQNFIESLMALNLVSNGYYIVFHGKLFKVPNVRKNRQKRTFEECL